MGIWIKEELYFNELCALIYLKSGWMLESCWSKLICLNTISCHVKCWSGMVCRRQHLQIQWLLICATCSLLQTARSSNWRQNKNGKLKKKKDDKREWATVRYSSCQAGTGSEECVGKNNRFSGEKRLLLMLFLLRCQCVWSYCQRLCSLYNSWIDGSLFPGGLGRRWRRGLAGQRRWYVLQTK